MTPDDLVAGLTAHPAFDGVRLLALHGSRSRGDARPGSDWDFGFLADDDLDLAGVMVALTTILGTDLVDLADLAGASALLRFRAARDGVALIERPPGEFGRFRLEAVRFWCDAGPVIRSAQADVLAGLG